MEIKKCPFCGGIGELTMDEKIEEMAKLMCGGCIDNELMTCSFTKEEIPCDFAKNFAESLYNAGYRKESDTAREILKWLVWNNHLFNRTHEIGFEKPRTSYLIMSDEIEELAEKYGVDLGE